MDTVQRPLWRAFPAHALGAAAEHAREGGLAVIKARSWRMLGATAPDGSVPPLIEWAIKALEPSPYFLSRRGPARGCVWTRVRPEDRAAVASWLDRDRAFEGTTTAFSFDCKQCAACCFGAEVVVEEADLRRFREAARADVVGRTSLGSDATWRLLPILQSTDACAYLEQDLRCGIYELRPDMCREFLAGSEHCLVSRQEKYGEMTIER